MGTRKAKMGLSKQKRKRPEENIAKYYPLCNKTNKRNKSIRFNGVL